MNNDEHNGWSSTTTAIGVGVIGVTYCDTRTQTLGAQYDLIDPEFYDANRGALLDFVSKKMADYWITQVARRPEIDISKWHSSDQHIQTLARQRYEEEQRSINDGLQLLHQAISEYIRGGLEAIAPSIVVGATHESGGRYNSFSNGREDTENFPVFPIIKKFLDENPSHESFRDSIFIAILANAGPNNGNPTTNCSIRTHLDKGIDLRFFDNTHHKLVDFIGDFIKWRDRQETPGAPNAPTSFPTALRM